MKKGPRVVNQYKTPEAIRRLGRTQRKLDDEGRLVVSRYGRGGTQVLRTRVRRSNSGAHITKRREWIVPSLRHDAERGYYTRRRRRIMPMVTNGTKSNMAQTVPPPLFFLFLFPPFSLFPFFFSFFSLVIIAPPARNLSPLERVDTEYK